MVAHDLAAPAQVILGLTELLLEHPQLDPFVRTRVDQVRRSATTLSSLVADLGRGLAEEGRPSLEVERVDLADLLASVVARSRILCSSKDMVIALTVREDRGGYRLDADPSQLERALGNLIGNAIKFSPARSTVRVWLVRAGAEATIRIADEGPGISAEGRHRIFEVFHREESTAHLPGLGLGLYITKHIVEGHGGRIEVDPSPGEGATFQLRLPLHPAEPVSASA